MNIEVQFKIGDKVTFLAAHDISAIVTAHLIRSSGHVTYEATWFHNGDRKYAWFDACELGIYEERQIGLCPEKPTEMAR